MLLFRRPMWSGQWPGTGPAGSGRALASNMKLFFAGLAGPGPHNSICGAYISGPCRALAHNIQCVMATPCDRVVLAESTLIVIDVEEIGKHIDHVICNLISKYTSRSNKTTAMSSGAY